MIYKQLPQPPRLRVERTDNDHALMPKLRHIFIDVSPQIPLPRFSQVPMYPPPPVFPQIRRYLIVSKLRLNLPQRHRCRCRCRFHFRLPSRRCLFHHYASCCYRCRHCFRCLSFHQGRFPLAQTPRPTRFNYILLC